MTSGSLCETLGFVGLTIYLKINYFDKNKIKIPSTLDKQSTAQSLDIETKPTDPIHNSEKHSLDITEKINAYKREIA